MNIDLQIAYWEEGAREDISTSQILIEKERYLHGLFFCHLAVEKMLKAIYVKKKEELAPKTHNLLYLSELCGISLTEDKINFFAILMKYQISGRYPDNTVAIRQSLALEYYLQTKEELKWLMMKLSQ